jgi:hypothetical protein
MLPDTDSLILFWSVARAQHHQHRMTTSWSAGGKDSQEVSGLRSVAGVLGSDSTTSARRTAGPSHRRTRMTPWSRRTAHSSRRTASASQWGNLLRARLRAYWGYDSLILSWVPQRSREHRQRQAHRFSAARMSMGAVTQGRALNLVSEITATQGDSVS